MVNDPAYKDEMLDGLRSIPSMSIVMEPEDLFGPRRGIYTNSEQRGSAWEHPASIEIIETDNGAFQTDSGIRIHGYSWRYHANMPKHSFRLEFRNEFGPTKLEYPLFPDTPVKRLKKVDLPVLGWATMARRFMTAALRGRRRRGSAVPAPAGS